MAWIREIIDYSLFHDLINYDPYPYKWLTGKAARVYELCIRHKHDKWADSIYKKYAYSRPSDQAVAFQLQLMASQITNTPTKLK